jgi:spore coat polysaccharide biosynthesis protein SpsF
MNITAIVQARIGSTRLPGKILKNLSGKPMLGHVVSRLSHSKILNSVVVATTDLAEDNETEAFCVKSGYSYYRGSSNDVLSRYYETALKFGADIVIRITSDCPVTDPVIIDGMLNSFLETSIADRSDYMSNVIVRTFPRGLDTEIFTFAALERANRNATEGFEREHVTPYIYRHPELFTLRNYTNDRDLSFHRWTVDTEEDFRLINEIYKELYRSDKIFLTADILGLFERRPDLFSINQSVKQKSLEE